MAEQEPKVVRVRHYTRVSAMRKILAEQRIVARDRNRVFVEKASARKLSPADAVLKYLLKFGKGNAYVEFDVLETELKAENNPLLGIEEHWVHGDVNLTGRNAEGFYNVR
jgi:hypothetical protein